MVKELILESKGQFSEELKKSIEMIGGPQENIHAVGFLPEEGAKDLYQSLKKITQLEDHVEIYPGAFSGSVCGRGLSGKPSSTIGFEKRHNEAMRFDNEKEFVDFMTTNVPPQPEGFKEMRKTNQGK
ncbi:hypothetical protein ACEF17_12305 [Streptococcus hyovaginalis]